MYEELIEALRYAYKTATESLSNPYRFCAYYAAAADAIEELSRQLAEYKKFDGFLMVHGMFGESVYVPNEPPKEET